MIRRPTLVAAAVVVLAAAGAGLWWKSDRGAAGADAAPRAASAGAASAGAAARAPAPPVSVTTVVTQRRDWPVMLAANGTVTSLNTVEVRPQVSSVITRVHIREGDFVRAGQPLFSLDSRNDEAGVARAEAQLQKDRAALADAERQLARSRELLAQNFISQSAVDTALANVAGQQAVVAASRAAVAAARVALGYGRISAPSAGRAGAINVYAGSYVQPAGTALVTITQLDPIAVSFTLPQRHLEDALAGLRRGDMPVRAQLPDGQTVLEGRLRFVDNAVDAASGAVKVKAVFDNGRLLLWPGAYVNVQLRIGLLRDAIVVPQAAIVQGATARTVFVAGADGKAVERRVEVLAEGGTEAVVKGLEAGERVVVEGRQNLRQGSPLRERPAAAGASAARGGAGRGDDAADPRAAGRNGGGAAASVPQP